MKIRLGITSLRGVARRVADSICNSVSTGKSKQPLNEKARGEFPHPAPFCSTVQAYQKPTLIEPITVRGAPIWAKGTLVVEVAVPLKPPT